jgi:hypothetical protein
MSTICMKLDPSIHIVMHLVCFSKTRCDKISRAVVPLSPRFGSIAARRGAGQPRAWPSPTLTVHAPIARKTTKRGRGSLSAGEEEDLQAHLPPAFLFQTRLPPELLCAASPPPALTLHQWPNASEDRGDAFCLSSLLKGKVHHRFAWSVGERFGGAQFQSVMQKWNCLFC